jgi:prepilin-type N-terminal cleavage/methylation domain-containing protein
MVSSPARPQARPFAAAFTLIELLTVVAIIGILAAITLGVSKGVNERAAINQARAELSALATALESYKRAYGDYPQTGSAGNNPTAPAASNSDGPGILFNALAGKRGPKVSPVAAIDGKRFVELERFSLQSTATSALPVAGNTTQLANAFVDPWGRRYLYFYKTSGTWTNPSYVLFSVGPDGHLQGNLPADGVLTNTFRDASSSGKGNADNIYAN